MIAPELKTNKDDLKLVAPDIERDSRLGVVWLSGKAGHQTLGFMGVPDHEIAPPTLEQEEARVRNFINRDDQLNWMIQFKGKVIGSIWVDLADTKYLQGPSVHIMIGDVSMRGKGVGKASLQAVINHLNGQGARIVFSRHLADNEYIAKVLKRLGFREVGENYRDEDGLTWHNVLLKLDNT